MGGHQFSLKTFLVVLNHESRQNQGLGLVDRQLVKAPVILLLEVPRRLFCFGSLVVLDVVFRYSCYILI